MSATIKGPYNYIAGSGISVGVVLNTSTGQFDVTVTNTSPGTSTPVSVPNGGTGDSSLTAHAVLIGEGTSAVGFAGPGSFGAPLLSTGASSDPAFSPLDLTNNFAVSGIPAHEIAIGATTGALTGLSPIGSSGQVLTSNGAGNDPSFQSLPTAPTVSGGAGIQVTGGPAYTVAVAAATAHAVMLTTGSPGFTSVAPGAAGTALISNGATSDPSYQTLGVSGGGTGLTSAAAHAVLIGAGTSAMHTAAPATAGQVLMDNGSSSDPSFQSPGIALLTKLLPSLTSGSATLSTGGLFQLASVTLTTGTDVLFVSPFSFSSNDTSSNIVFYGMSANTNATIQQVLSANVPSDTVFSATSVSYTTPVFHFTGLTPGSNTFYFLAQLNTAPSTTSPTGAVNNAFAIY
jgi:hypothetical protein